MYKFVMVVQTSILSLDTPIPGINTSVYKGTDAHKLINISELIIFVSMSLT